MKYLRALRGIDRLALLIGGLGLWEVGAATGMIDRTLFPAPSVVGGVIVTDLMHGRLLEDAGASVSRVLVGVAIACVLGVGIGFLMHHFRLVARYLGPVLDVVRPISVIAWIPIAIIWFGIGDESAWFIIFLGAFFPVLTNTVLGLDRIPKGYILAAQSLGAGRTQIFTDVMVPAALPYILTGLRIGLGVGWMCVIAAEMIGAPSGLGYAIQLSRTLIETERVIGGMIVIGIIGLTMNQIMIKIEQVLIKG